MAGAISIPNTFVQQLGAAGQGLNSPIQAITTNQPFVETWALYSIVLPWVVVATTNTGSLASTQPFNFRLYVDGTPVFVSAETAQLVSELVTPPVGIAAGMITSSFATPIPFDAGSTLSYSFDAVYGGAPQAFTLTIYIGYGVIGSAQVVPDQAVILYETSRRTRPLTGALELNE